jgi:hypothetical protein
MATPFVLTQRDVDILQSLSQVRYLTVQHLQWLHWGERWRAAERAARDGGSINRQPKRAYARVAAMVERGLIHAFQRTSDRAKAMFQRLPHCYSLARAGAELLAAQRSVPLEQVWYAKRATRSAATLEHSLAIGAFYAALRAEADYRGRAISNWAGDHILCTDYDSVAAPSVGHPLPIIPDATWVLDGTRFFLEIDRGTTGIEQWRKKALAYRAYGHDARLVARYGVSRFEILVVAPTATRIAAIARTLATAHGGVAPNYRFLHEGCVHPFQIRRRWQRMDTVTFVQAKPVVTFRDDALWHPHPGEQLL